VTTAVTPGCAPWISAEIIFQGLTDENTFSDFLKNVLTEIVTGRAF
jgi:hypothetical protein